MKEANFSPRRYASLGYVKRMTWMLCLDVSMHVSTGILRDTERTPRDTERMPRDIERIPRDIEGILREYCVITL